MKEKLTGKYHFPGINVVYICVGIVSIFPFLNCNVLKWNFIPFFFLSIIIITRNNSGNRRLIDFQHFHIHKLLLLDFFYFQCSVCNWFVCTVCTWNVTDIYRYYLKSFELERRKRKKHSFEISFFFLVKIEQFLVRQSGSTDWNRFHCNI